MDSSYFENINSFDPKVVKFGRVESGSNQIDNAGVELVLGPSLFEPNVSSCLKLCYHSMTISLCVCEDLSL